MNDKKQYMKTKSEKKACKRDIINVKRFLKGLIKKNRNIGNMYLMVPPDNKSFELKIYEGSTNLLVIQNGDKTDDRTRETPYTLAEHIAKTILSGSRYVEHTASVSTNYQENNGNVITLDRVQKICSQRYKFNEHRVIVIVLARYTIKAVENMVRNNYAFWNEYSGTDVDFYWLGYSADEIRIGNTSLGLVFLDFDTKSFVNDLKNLSRIQKHRFGDSVGFLLCNFYDGKLHYDSSVFIDIERLVQSPNDTDLRKVTECLIEACAREQEAKNVGTIIRTEMNARLVQGEIVSILPSFISGAGTMLEILKI